MDNAKRLREYRKNKKLSGECYQCHEKAIKGRTRCIHHLTKQAEWVRQKRNKYHKDVVK